jgi:hypothetical protein
MQPPIEKIIPLAKEKINKEFENLGNVGKKEQAVSSYVHNILSDACDQSQDFAEVILNFKRTLKDCLVSIMKGTGNAVSDIDVYRSAIQFYFPNSEISCTTTITLTGDAPDENIINKPSPVEKAKASADGEEAPKKAKPAKEKQKQKSSENLEAQSIQLSLF